MTTVTETIPIAARIAEADMEIAALEDQEARQYAAWLQTTGELEHLVAERDRLREQQGALPFCDTCGNHHLPPKEPCPPPGGCADCEAEAGEPCRPGCLSRNEIDYGGETG